MQCSDDERMNNDINILLTELAVSFSTNGYAIVNLTDETIFGEKLIDIDACLLQHWYHIIQNQPWKDEYIPKVMCEKELLSILRGVKEFPKSWEKIPWTWHKSYMGYCNDSSSFHLPYQKHIRNCELLKSLAAKILQTHDSSKIVSFPDRAYQCLPTLQQAFRSWYVPHPIILQRAKGNGNEFSQYHTSILHGMVTLTRQKINIVPCSIIESQSEKQKFIDRSFKKTKYDPNKIQNFNDRDDNNEDENENENDDVDVNHHDIEIGDVDIDVNFNHDNSNDNNSTVEQITATATATTSLTTTTNQQTKKMPLSAKRKAAEENRKIKIMGPSAQMINKKQISLELEPGDLLLLAPGTFVQRHEPEMRAIKKANNSGHKLQRMRYMEIGTNVTWFVQHLHLDCVIQKKLREEKNAALRFKSALEMTEYAEKNNLPPILSIVDYGKTRFTYLPIQVLRHPKAFFKQSFPKFKTPTDSLPTIALEFEKAENENRAPKITKAVAKPFVITTE